MRRLVPFGAAGALALATLTVPSVAGAQPTAPPDPLGSYQHLVVIYEENHSFDNLYGMWGQVSSEQVDGISGLGQLSGVTQVDQARTPYSCLLQKDANLVTTSDTVTWIDHSTHPGLLKPTCSTTAKGAAYNSAFKNKPFRINAYVQPSDPTCPPPPVFIANGVENGDPQGLPGGCTRDIVHRFYQEQYQLDGGRMDRYTTGSDAAGLTQGYYDTQNLPVWQYLHAKGAPNYVIADHLFQGAFGGSFLNHQYLVAAQAPQWNTSEAALPATANSVLDGAGFPNKTYPLYAPDPSVAYNDAQLTQACGLSTTVKSLACGNYAVNTIQPASVPHAASGLQLPLINDTDPSQPFYEANIGDRMSAAGVSWAWYAGGWDAANAGHADPLFQYHHQPFNYFAAYAPGQPGRAHLQDETAFVSAAQDGTLPQVSFVKPVGEENEHPGYASTDNGEQHLVSLLKTVLGGPEGKDTLVVVTYDEFGGQWDHVSPPGQAGTPGPADQFGPGTRVPALVIGGSFTHSGVDHRTLDTTSILATIEHGFGVAPLAARDAEVADLGSAVALGS
jgi:phospholipase C